MTTGRINQVAVRTWVGSQPDVRRHPTGPEFNDSGTTRFLDFECGGTLVNWQTFPSVLVFSGFCTEKHSHGERSPPLRLFELWYGLRDHITRKQSSSRDHCWPHKGGFACGVLVFPPSLRNCWRKNVDEVYWRRIKKVRVENSQNMHLQLRPLWTVCELSVQQKSVKLTKSDGRATRGGFSTRTSKLNYGRTFKFSVFQCAIDPPGNMLVHTMTFFCVKTAVQSDKRLCRSILFPENCPFPRETGHLDTKRVLGNTRSRKLQKFNILTL